MTQEQPTDYIVSISPAIFTIGTTVLISVLGILAWFVKGLINDLKKSTISNAIQKEQMGTVLSQLGDIKKGMEGVQEISVQLARVSVNIDNLKSSNEQLAKQIYDNNRDIMKIKDDITHIFKELKH